MNSFDVDHYAEMVLAFVQAGYGFYKFQDIELLDKAMPFVILRHDVDFSIDAALEIAELESSLGIQSTFFFQLRSPLYNLLSDHASTALHAMHDWGHDIALHFDLGYYRSGLSRQLVDELRSLCRFYPFANTKIVSLHRPRKFAMALRHLELPATTRHTYEKRYTRDIAYFSDSGGQWRSQHPLQSNDFQSAEPMQLLLHPLWWTESGHGIISKLASFLRKDREQTIDFLEETTVSFSLAELRDQLQGT